MNGKKNARQISAELGAVLLDTLGLTAAIEWRARQFQKLTGVFCKLTVDPAAPVGLPEDYAATIFDFYNQALSNVARHAMASRVAIALTITPRDVTVKFSLPLA
jgi:two-component system, NarL family, sensor histidine kinase UhpB